MTALQLDSETCIRHQLVSDACFGIELESCHCDDWLRLVSLLWLTLESRPERSRNMIYDHTANIQWPCMLLGAWKCTHKHARRHFMNLFLLKRRACIANALVGRALRSARSPVLQNRQNNRRSHRMDSSMNIRKNNRMSNRTNNGMETSMIN